MGLLDKFTKGYADKRNEAKKHETKPSPLKFTIISWGEFAENITKWQNENARDQWINAKYSSKRLFQYSWETLTENVRLVPEPNNRHDKNAIAVYLKDSHVGYVPRPVNEQHYKKLIASSELKADIHGGSFKYLDEYGDLIVDKEESPKIDITILL